MKQLLQKSKLPIFMFALPFLMDTTKPAPACKVTAPVCKNALKPAITMEFPKVPVFYLNDTTCKSGK